MPITPNGFPANIIKSHGRTFQRLVFVIWPDQWQEQEIRNWLRSVVPQLTYYDGQNKQYERKDDEPDEPLRSLSLSASGYRTAGLPFTMLNTEDASRRHYFDQSLRTNKYAAEFWAYGNGRGEQASEIEMAGGEEWHCCLLIASNSKSVIEGRTSALLSTSGGDNMKKLWLEDAAKKPLRTSDDPDLGPLDFVDGITNPKVEEEVYNLAARQDFNVNGRKGYGSFMVYQKIKINNDKFRDAVASVSSLSGYGKIYNSSSGTSGYSREDFGRASLMGRFVDGTPISNPHGNLDTEIDYRSADAAKFCPFFAHTRAANPRTAGPGSPNAPIVRRGLPFFDGASRPRRETADKGTPFGATNKHPDGLHFISYQNGISRLVDVMNDMKAAKDVIVYRGKADIAGDCPTDWGMEPNKRMLTGAITKILNLEAFFAPSREYLWHHLELGFHPGDVPGQSV